MPVDYSALKPGQVVSNQTYRLDAETVTKYVDAVGDRSGLFDGATGPAPPMAVAALALRGIVKDLALTNGALHAGQELAFERIVSIGETLECQATVVQTSVRGEWQFVVVRTEISDGAGMKVMDSKSTLAIPTQVTPSQGE